jgi:short-subunit dehydrogenase
MRARLARLGMRTIVITGASSGIGLTTARRAAARGARLLVSSRNEPALRDLRDELRADGAQIEYAVADVGRLEEMQALAGKAIEAFGGFDTWVNNAGAATYGKILETPIADQRQVLETNYWGVVHGSIIAVRHFRAREGGGKLINVGSVLSDFSVPEQGPYAASKHAVKAFTTALRLEIMHDKVPVSVTLIKPSAIASPYKDHARNYMDSPGRMPPPVYAPDLVADAILHAAERHVSELTVGSAGRPYSSNWFRRSPTRSMRRSAPRCRRIIPPASGSCARAICSSPRKTGPNAATSGSCENTACRWWCKRIQALPAPRSPFSPGRRWS